MRRAASGRSRRGVITFLVATAIVVVVAIAALAIDGGQLYAERRGAQAAADAAAMAAALELYHAAAAETPFNAASAARAEGLLMAEENGYSSDRASVTVNTPPTEGAYAGQAGYVEVIIDVAMPRSFSNIFGGGDNHVRARAVAAGTLEPTKASVLVLDPKKKKSLHLNKKGTLLETKGDVIVNSKHKQAAEVGKGAEVIAENLLLSSKLDKKVFKHLRERVRGEIQQELDPTPDPFADLPVPEEGPSRKLEDFLQVEDGKNVYKLKPGKYSEKLDFRENDVVTMEEGVYTLEKELNVKKGAVLEGHDVTIYSTGKRKLKFDSSEIALTPPDSGPYKDISIFMDPGKKGKIEFKKDANVDMSGVIYGPNAEIKFKDVDMELEGDDDADEEEEEESDEADDPDDEDDEDDEWEVDDGSPMTTGAIGASIIARKLKIDKKSHVRVLGDAIPARKPVLRLVE